MPWLQPLWGGGGKYATSRRKLLFIGLFFDFDFNYFFKNESLNKISKENSNKDVQVIVILLSFMTRNTSTVLMLVTILV